MKHDWNDLQVFLAIERGGTARAAGHRLKCSHATALRRLDSFEQRLGVRLFDRTPGGFVLTVAGEAILGKAQQIEAEMLEVERVVTGSDVKLQGSIRLTVPPPIAEFLLMDALVEFQEKYPEIDIEIVSTYGYSNLSRRDADMAIRFSHSPDEHLVGRRLPPFYDSIFASPAYVEKHWGKDAKGEPKWIEWDDPSAFRERISESRYAENPTYWRLPTLGLQTVAAEKGLGMAFLPNFMGTLNPNLVRVPNAEYIKGIPGWVLTHPDLRRMERVRVLAQFLYEALVAKKIYFGGAENGADG